MEQSTTSVKLENVCPHGFWTGQGAAPCPFCHPECYANGTQGTIAPLITVNLNTLLDSAKDARISQLEAQLREREAECERLDEARIELKNLVQQWEDWLSDLQADFVGLTAEKNQLHEWEWIEEHRCWPPCICEES